MTPYEKVPRVGFKSKSLMLDEPPSDDFFVNIANQISKQGFLQNFPFLWIEPFGGTRIPSVASDATAYPHRNIFGNFMLIDFWLTAGSKTKGLDWLNETMTLNEKEFTDRAYINFLDADLDNWERLYYRDNYSRLQSVKKEYDPTNCFRFKQSTRLPVGDESTVKIVKE